MDSATSTETFKLVGAIVAAIATIFGAGWVFKVMISKKKVDNNIVVQKGNNVGGDNAGRDINK